MNVPATMGSSCGALVMYPGTSMQRLLHEILPHIRLIAGRHHNGTPDRVEATVCDVLATVHRVRHTYVATARRGYFTQWLKASMIRRGGSRGLGPESRFVRRFARNWRVGAVGFRWSFAGPRRIVRTISEGGSSLPEV